MLQNILALLILVVVSPLGDGINGYFKYPDGSCSALAVLSPSRMAFLCGQGKILVGEVTYIDLPDPFHPACLREVLLGLKAMATLKYGLYTASDIRTTGAQRVDGKFQVGVMVDLEPLDSVYFLHMKETTRNRTRGDWCSA